MITAAEAETMFTQVLAEKIRSSGIVHPKMEEILTILLTSNTLGSEVQDTILEIAQEEITLKWTAP